MKLVCTIGTQGLPDGRRIHRGEVYEVDDVTASTALAAGYATKYVEPIADVAKPVEDAPVAAEQKVVEETDTPEPGEEPKKIDRRTKEGRRSR